MSKVFTSMKRILKKSAVRFAPRPARFAKDAIFTLNGWRFDDLKAHTTQVLKAEAHQIVVAQHSLERLRRMDSSGAPLAIVSAVPPDDTGIANFTIQAFKGAPYPVDVFARFTSVASYLSLLHDRALRQEGLNFFGLDVLPAARAQRGYVAEVYEIGNSNHNVPVMDALAQRARFAVETPAFAHIHDPCLLNLLREFCVYRGRNFHDALAEAYGIDPRKHLADMAIGSYMSLIQEGMLGPRALFANLPLTGVITNSVAASRLIARDWPDLDEVRLHTLFHPVFPHEMGVPPPARNTIRIGTFGVPSRAKCSDLVLAAFDHLSRNIPGLELVLAGYNAGVFARSHGIAGRKDVLVEDAPSDVRLFELMQSCQLAVQLRRHNLGESSGIIPQLMAFGVPVIVSRIGALAEYDDAVAYAEPGCDAAELAELMERELRGAGLRTEAQRNYAARRTPAIFCRSLRELCLSARSIASEEAHQCA